MYVKIIDDRLEYAPKVININNKRIINPDKSMLLELGYKHFKNMLRQI